MKKRRFLGSVVLVSLGLVACGSPAQPPQPLLPVAKAGQISVFEPRVRLPPTGRDQSAAYMVLTNQGDTPDRLIGAKSPFASTIELHTHAKTPDGMTMMRQVREIDIPANATVPLSPGGLHLMLKGMRPDVKVGQSLPVKLIFSSGAQASFMMPIVVNPSQPAGQKNDDGSDHKH